MNKYVDETWDFRGAETKNYTHCFHSYPAMMIPQVASRLLDRYGQKARLVLDPFCGTGTSLVEANLRGVSAVGVDLNPLACLIAQTKTTTINFKKLDLYLKDFNDFLFAERFNHGDSGVNLPKFPNIDFWFDKQIQRDLAKIKKYIGDVEETDVQNFFKVAFSEVVRESSWTRNGEFKLYRMTEEQRRRFQPDVFGSMEAKLARNRNGLQAFAVNKKSSQTTVHRKDSTETAFDEKFDLVLTSPPYGDSRTTVAYGQFSRLSNQWLDFENAASLDNRLLGGKTCKEKVKFESKVLRETLCKIAERDEKRNCEVASFYADYQKSINNVSQMVKTNGFACFVVGNRKVKSVNLPTDKITVDFFGENNFRHIETIVRNIPNKRMPRKNSPTNIVGAKDDTMTQEFIVVLQKNSF
jgi:site-specific DNA-methyltransferase (cytosine-N4-specific)